MESHRWQWPLVEPNRYAVFVVDHEIVKLYLKYWVEITDIRKYIEMSYLS